MRKSASEMIRSLESRIARLEKQAGTNYIINDFKVPSNFDNNQIASELEEQLQDMFDGSVQWQITDIKHNNKMMSAKGTFSLKAPITVEKSAMQLILDGDVPYSYYDVLYEDEITMIHFEGVETQFFLNLNESQGQPELEINLQATSPSHTMRSYFYDEIRNILLDNFGNWRKSDGDRNLILETRFNESEDNVEVAKKVVSLAREIEKILKPSLKRTGLRLR